MYFRKCNSVSFIVFVLSTDDLNVSMRFNVKICIYELILSYLFFVRTMFQTGGNIYIYICI